LEWCKSQDILLKIISSDEDPRDMENLDSWLSCLPNSEEIGAFRFPMNINSGMNGFSDVNESWIRSENMKIRIWE
jgi:hypothetical protein